MSELEKSSNPYKRLRISVDSKTYVDVWVSKFCITTETPFDWKSGVPVSIFLSAEID
ncbi:hypothetical protein [Mycobacteroides abscessus]|uniref:hypothetical protein n=1 Tax=Mycobacteroides abscessus TaxID=36809 RepID=UPI0009D5E094|nr:hypothetical protein [Mycobacteroides abscessus]MDO3206619.1 hypothetical protein [Mycobacteroides abscessus subsp. massiliense]SKI81865.1 Uncharacterised protein [Mycobacteroides abscessus subsp. massiliense]SKR74103.1 Uncharacterised protein [Mycobacteroides abscessus subsp. massiliense]SKS39132.1 Uncharacterised protein [Mycobacteroides abscessus subsp. massiliense]SKS90613.1 Uncharacterised protein [Mycobacteroides abscessus subsp. massiliense]